MEITTTVRNSLCHLQHPTLTIPWGRGNPADFTFPSKYLCLGTFHICFLLPESTALHKQATTAILPSQTSGFFPFFFFSFCTMSHRRKVITDQGKGHVYCLHLSFVQVYAQPSEKSKAADCHAKRHRHLAPTPNTSSKGALAHHTIYFHLHINCFNFFPTTSRLKIKFLTYQVLFFPAKS